jgi:hypothetical protein
MQRGYELDVDTLIAQLEVRLNEEGAQPIPRARLKHRQPVRRWRRAALVAAAAFSLALALAVPVLLLDQDEPAGPAEPSPSPTVAPTAPEPTANPAEPTIPSTVAVDEEQPAPATTDATPENPAFDYDELGTPSGESDTSVGLLNWIYTARVPYDWIEAGFPGPGHSYGPEFLNLHQDRTLNAALYQVPNGYLGLGAGEDTRELLMDWPGTLNNTWYPPHYTFVFVTELWHSGDGATWELMAEDPFGPGAAVMHDPFAIAEHDGRWIVIGWVDVPDDDRYDQDPDLAIRAPVPASSPPAIWVSEDLRNWTRLDVDFDVEGAYTALSSVVASEHGWVIGGVRTTVESPIRAEWAMWTSPDGLDWTEIPVADVFGEPDCKPNPARFCNRLAVKIENGAIAAYGWVWNDVQGPPPVKNARWSLWVASLSEEAAR